jgi:hypothetical protein
VRCFFAPVCSRPPPLKSRTKRYDDLLNFNEDPKLSLLFPSLLRRLTSNIIIDDIIIDDAR